MTAIAPRLKWHMLRRRKADAAFLRANLRAALAAAADGPLAAAAAGSPPAMEVDLRLTADGHALCLHDRTLDRETSGTGPVSAHLRADIERLRQRAPDGALLADAPLFLDELATVVGKAPGIAPATVQLDVKLRADALDAQACARFGAVLGGHSRPDNAGRFIASGADWRAVCALADAAPGLHRGFDPLALYPRDLALDADGFRVLAARTLDVAPRAAIYYLEANLVLAALARGVNLVEEVSRDGAMVDAWTVDADRPHLDDLLRQLIAAGVHQVTSNDPEALAPRIAHIVAGTPANA